MCKSKRSKKNFFLFRVLYELGFKSTTPLEKRKPERLHKKGSESCLRCCGVSLVNTITPRKKSEFDDVLDE